MRHKTNGGQEVCGQKKRGKACKRRSLRSVKADCGELAHKWLARVNDPTKRREDHSSTDVLDWWEDNDLEHAEIVDLVKGSLCAQASSATLERTFSKVGLTVSKNR